VPHGEELARRTFNPRLGIVGGISIIGTTGIVEPKSSHALKTSLLCALDVAGAQGHDSLVMAPGRIGEKGVKRLIRLEEDQVVQMGNYVGFMLEAALERGFRRILLAGHPGKLLKLMRGDFMTHSSKSESAVPLIMEELSRIEGELADKDYYKNLQTVEGFIQSLPQDVSQSLFGRLADGVQHAAENYVDGKMEIGVILLSMKGEVVGESVGSRSWRTDC
jgi:cobalt-precorrin-5B (C1)-methyltransferase